MNTGSNSKVLMLDYDGTLAPFHLKRDEAYPYPGVLDRLKEIMKESRLVIISGRPIEDLKKFLPINPLPELFGNHGIEQQGKPVNLPDIFFEGLHKAENLATTNLPPSQIEKKTYSIALHWRGHPEAKKSIETLIPLLMHLTKRYPLTLHTFNGGVEIRPQGKGKQDAVSTILKTTPKGAKVAYLGDDLTDEDAFKALGNRGLKVLVHQNIDRHTLADLVLHPPEELIKFLDDWIKNKIFSIR